MAVLVMPGLFAAVPLAPQIRVMRHQRHPTAEIGHPFRQSFTDDLAFARA
ncbi:hypothetical protein [Mesorhizobium sp. IMUNJ 23232]